MTSVHICRSFSLAVPTAHPTCLLRSTHKPNQPVVPKGQGGFNAYVGQEVDCGAKFNMHLHHTTILQTREAALHAG